MKSTVQKPGSALVLLGHGSTVNPDSSAPTRRFADEIRLQGLFAEVVCAFWKEDPGFRHALDLVKSPEVYIVPNFISEGYFTRKIIPRELGLTGQITRLPPAPGHPAARTLKYCEPVGNHPRVTELILHRAREIAPGVAPRNTALVIVGHGTPLDENSRLAVRAQVARIQIAGLYGEVLGMFLEEKPFIADWQKLTSAPDVIVVPLFISDGLHSYQDIPLLLGIEPVPKAPSRNAAVFRRDPYNIGGRRLYYSSAIGADPLFAGIILDQVAQFDTQHPSLSTAA